MEISLKCVIRCPKNGCVELEEQEDAVVKVVQDWKPPKVPLYDVYHKKAIFLLGDLFQKRKGIFESVLGGCAIKTLEKTVSIQNEGEVEFPLHASRSIKLHKLRYGYLHTGLVQVGVKPLTRNALNTSALVFLRDGRFLKFKDSVLATMETSLSDGPVYFNYCPNFPIALEDALITWKLYVRTQNEDGGDKNQEGSKDIAIVYRVYYKVMTSRWLHASHSKVSSGRRKTTFIQTNLLKDNVAVENPGEWESSSASDEVET